MIFKIMKFFLEAMIWTLYLIGYCASANFLTSLDISDVETVWTWGDKRPPHKKTEKTRDFEQKISIRNMVEIA